MSRFLSTGLVLAFASWPAAAATTPSPPGAPQDEAAQQAFRAGVDAARQENWAEALTQFEKAYSLSPRPVVLINLAGAQARTGRLTEAAKNYHRILDDYSSQENASFRKAALEVLPALEARIPRVRLRPPGPSPDDVIQIDGEVVEAGSMAAGHPLDPGEHTLVVHQAGHERARVLFSLVERELRYITLPVPRLTPPPPRASVAENTSAGNPDAGRADVTASRSWVRSPWTWTAVAVVVAGAAVTTFLLLDDNDEAFMGNIPPGTVNVGGGN